MKPLQDPCPPVHLSTPLDGPPTLTVSTRRALLIDLEPATTELITLWLEAEGWELRSGKQAGEKPSVLIVGLAFPRRGDNTQRLAALTAAWPQVPVLVLSPTFFRDTPASGDVARQLGVAAVLATPVSREQLLAVLRDLTGPLMKNPA